MKPVRLLCYNSFVPLLYICFCGPEGAQRSIAFLAFWSYWPIKTSHFLFIPSKFAKRKQGLWASNINCSTVCFCNWWLLPCITSYLNTLAGPLVKLCLNINCNQSCFFYIILVHFGRSLSKKKWLRLAVWDNWNGFSGLNCVARCAGLDGFLLMSFQQGKAIISFWPLNTSESLYWWRWKKLAVDLTVIGL